MKKLAMIPALLACGVVVWAEYLPKDRVFIGDDLRIGIGGDSENKWRLEYLHLLHENERSAWLGETWLGEDAGGVKLNYHWLWGKKDKPLIMKTFIAADQNKYQDQKLTVGLGAETPHYFYNAYVSSRLTGKRGTAHEYDQQPYDYGVGVRVGHYFANKQVRLQTGLDYETGEDENRQYTWSVGLEKFFYNSPHSIGVTTALNRKTGSLVNDKHDAQIMAVWRYTFGNNYRPAKTYQKVQVSRPVAAPVMQTVPEKKLIKHTLTMRADAFFAFNSDQFTPVAVKALSETLTQIKEQDFIAYIKITGHTCDIGNDAYNQKLSEKRAQAVKNFFAQHKIAADKLLAEGQGESQPKYLNDGESNRSKNRRVDIELITEKTETQVVEQPAPVKPATEVQWVEQEIDSEPAWLRRALRHPVAHKQTIESYAVTDGKAGINPNPLPEQPTDEGNNTVNQAPIANDDRTITYTLNPIEIDVLANDSDPDGDSLSIITVTSGRYGIVSTDGLLATYDPDQKFIDDLFTYTISDGHGNTAKANVVVVDP